MLVYFTLRFQRQKRGPFIDLRLILLCGFGAKSAAHSLAYFTLWFRRQSPPTWPPWTLPSWIATICTASVPLIQSCRLSNFMHSQIGWRHRKRQARLRAASLGAWSERGPLELDLFYSSVPAPKLFHVVPLDAAILVHHRPHSLCSSHAILPPLRLYVGPDWLAPQQQAQLRAARWEPDPNATP